jgi:hypothetical protein
VQFVQYPENGRSGSGSGKYTDSTLEIPPPPSQQTARRRLSRILKLHFLKSSCRLNRRNKMKALSEKDPTEEEPADPREKLSEIGRAFWDADERVMDIAIETANELVAKKEAREAAEASKKAEDKAS